MAGRPLRPATDRSLGRPLPHQLANQAQATPKAHHCFEPQPICGISPSFPGLSPTFGHIPTCYSPVRRSPCGAHDLHVLSMPPAFTLSQDQTLKFISIITASAQKPTATIPQELTSKLKHPALTHNPNQPKPTRIISPPTNHQTCTSQNPYTPDASRASHPQTNPKTSQPQSQPISKTNQLTQPPKQPRSSSIIFLELLPENPMQF